MLLKAACLLVLIVLLFAFPLTRSIALMALITLAYLNFLLLLGLFAVACAVVYFFIPRRTYRAFPKSLPRHD